MDNKLDKTGTFCPLLSIGQIKKVPCDIKCAWYYIREHDSGGCALYNIARYTGDLPDYGTKL